jgi:hypothetical protein
MKIKGSGASPPVGPPDEVAPGRPGRASRARGRDFAARVERASAAARTDAPNAVAASTGPRRADPIQAIAAELRAGRINAAQASHRLIDDVINRRLGGALTPALERKLRSILAEVLGRDPALAARLRRIAPRK